MERKQAGIFRLLIIMGFFGLSIFLLNNNKKNGITATHIDICNAKVDTMIGICLDVDYQHLSSLLATHDIDLIVGAISKCKSQHAFDFMEKAIRNTASCLSCDEKVKIIYGMVMSLFPKKKSPV